MHYEGDLRNFAHSAVTMTKSSQAYLELINKIIISNEVIIGICNGIFLKLDARIHTSEIKWQHPWRNGWSNVDNWNFSAQQCSHTHTHTSQTIAVLKHLKPDYILPHLSYSPNLAPCDFIFPNLKEHLKGHWYTSNDEMQAAVHTRLQERTSDSSSMGCNN